MRLWGLKSVSDKSVKLRRQGYTKNRGWSIGFWGA